MTEKADNMGVECLQMQFKEEDGLAMMDYLTEDEYLDILDKLPRENQMLDDDDPEKFIAKMAPSFRTLRVILSK